MFVMSGTRRMWQLRNVGSLTDAYSLTADQHNVWLTGGTEADVIAEAHLDPDSIFAGVQHFAQDRAKRLSRQRELLADMEGPAVKRFVTACSISRPMLTSAQCARERGRIPEDADARLTMERLRRRIRLICAGCSEEQSRMTPLRRELPPSRGASRPDPKTGRRIASARTLQSCSHRAVADAARESRSHLPSTSAHFSHDSYAAELRLPGPVMAAQMNPTSSRAIAATATGVRLPWPTRWR